MAGSSTPTGLTPTGGIPDLAKYELLEEIGHGGMATVYRAIDRRLERDVAVKVIHRHLRENLEVSARFVGEARAVAKLRHPNIVEVYDVSEADDPERYLVMELVRGTTLRRLLRREPDLPTEIAAAIAVEVGQALGHAHQQGVIHRDIKPENVLVDLGRDEDGTDSGRPPAVKLTDFGIAKVLDAQGVTSTGQVLGSPAHMAPEQIEAGAVTARADVFGLGVLFYECLTGVLPFAGKNPAQVLRRVLEGAFTPADRVRATVGTRYAAIVGRALAKDPEDRYASADDFVAALRRELGRLGFQDSRKELGRFIRDPITYRESHQERTVEALRELGRAARDAGRIQDAAAAFNRALAYRPQDQGLLVEVSGLARRGERRRWLLRGGALLGVVAIFAGLSLGGRALLSPSPARADASASASASEPAPTSAGSAAFASASAPTSAGSAVASSAPAPTASAATSAPPSGSAVATAAPDPRPGPGGGRPPPATRPRVPAAAPTTRQVQFALNLPSTRLLVDGTPTEWFGRTVTLSVGPHRFEYVPPNTECCVARTVTRTVEAGDGVLTISGGVGIKQATVSTHSSLAAGTRVSCQFGGAGVRLTAPGSQRIAVSPEGLSGECSIIPPPDSGLDARSRSVSLSPGKTVVLR